MALCIFVAQRILAVFALISHDHWQQCFENVPQGIKQQTAFEAPQPGPLLVSELCLLYVKLLQREFALEVDLKAHDIPLVDLHQNGRQVEQARRGPSAILKDPLSQQASEREKRVNEVLNQEGEQAHRVEQEWRQSAFVLGHPLVIVDPYEEEDVKDGQI